MAYNTMGIDMEIVIVGAGAMGSLFGARLAPFAKVHLFTTNSDHAMTISRDGLTITESNGVMHRVAVMISTDLNQIPHKADLVLICTKAGATQEAARTARAVLKPEGLVLTLQNGFGNIERIATVVEEKRVLGGTTAQAATLTGPGQIRHAGNGPTYLAALSEYREKIDTIARLFNQAGLACFVVDDIDSLLWSKLLVNVGINALAALLRVTNGVLADVAACNQLMVSAVEEGVAVARALRIDLAFDQQVERVQAVCRQTCTNRASMLQDILRGAPTEVEYINGAVVRKGSQLGIATPVNMLLVQLIKALEATASHRI